MRIIMVVGARPQFIKAATVSRALEHISDIHGTIIHTGQHFDDNMSRLFFDELEIPKPDYNLGIGGGSHGSNTGRMIEAIEKVLMDENPDWMMVYGDTDSTLAGALAAVKIHIPVAHVEAGLRSYNRRMPEEINRILTDQIATVLFCPTQTSIKNLKNEGFPHQIAVDTKQLILNVGDVMHDAALFYGSKAEEKSRVMEQHGLQPKQFALATVHRAENTDDPIRLQCIVEALGRVAKDIPLVLPLHPRTRKKLEMLPPSVFSHSSTRIRFIDPVGYLDMVMLEKNAAVIATDSGGVQKEAFFHRVPCVTLRNETEWVELVGMGWNRLAPPLCEDIAQAVLEAAGSIGEHGNPYGDGNAAFKILDVLAKR
jgi:UDP-GlcNAc3NAcA epimerase